MCPPANHRHFMLSGRFDVFYWHRCQAQQFYTAVTHCVSHPCFFPILMYFTGHAESLEMEITSPKIYCGYGGKDALHQIMKHSSKQRRLCRLSSSVLIQLCSIMASFNKWCQTKSLKIEINTAVDIIVASAVVEWLSTGLYGEIYCTNGRTAVLIMKRITHGSFVVY